MKTRSVVTRWSATLVALWCSTALASTLVPQTQLPGKSIPKYVDPLPTFVGARVPANTPATSAYTLSMEEFQQPVLPSSVYAGVADPQLKQGTFVWGYRITDATGKEYGPLYPGFSVEAKVGVQVTATYVNNLQQADGSPPFLQKYLTIDQTLHWADPNELGCALTPIADQQAKGCWNPYQGSQPAVVHLHGGEVDSRFDGGPEEWFTPSGLHGPAYSSAGSPAPNQAIYEYPNQQQAATLWFHDHALGATRINVYGGMAAFYLLRDDADTGLTTNPLNLPAGAQEIEIAIQDRNFDTNGQLFWPDLGVNPCPPGKGNVDCHPFARPEFFGDTIVVNGKSWPYLEVEPRRYRLRLLNGSNARMYDMALGATGSQGPAIYQIGTDGGLLDAPAAIRSPRRLFLAPGERADVIVDFATVPAGTVLTLDNDAKAPFPRGAAADPQTTGQLMQFRVVKPLVGTDTTCNPASPAGAAGACNLRPGNPIVRLANPATGQPNVTPDVKRQLTLKEIPGATGPLEVMLNNTRWTGFKESTMTSGNPTPIPDSVQTGVDTWTTELPRVGATEQWEIINLTADAHPIHLHLVQFQLVSRQPFNQTQYLADWTAAFPGGVFPPGDGPPLPYGTQNADGALGGNLPISKYLQAKPSPPPANEAGWKDTIVAQPSEVTKILVRYAPTTLALGTTSPGANAYPFDPTSGPGYVWHCHIIDHEDNEMMRPQVIQK